MAKGSDPFGSTDPTTEYDGQPRPFAGSGGARSAWSVGVAAVVLVLILAAMFFWTPESTKPAPNEAAVGTGVDRSADPVAVRQ
jgi:hypothetical protein